MTNKTFAIILNSLNFTLKTIFLKEKKNMSIICEHYPAYVWCNIFPFECTIISYAALIAESLFSLVLNHFYRVLIDQRNFFVFMFNHITCMATSMLRKHIREQGSNMYKNFTSDFYQGILIYTRYFLSQHL